MRRRHDEGFSLTELMVVMALLTLVVAGAWSLLRVVTISSEQNKEQSWQSLEIGAPLNNAERMFSQQAPPLQQAGPYVCQIRTDQDRDNLYEYHTYEATADGRLTDIFYEQPANPATVVVPVTRVWSRNNDNRAAGVPMFRYFDIDGLDISDHPATQIQQYAASINITIVADLDGRQYRSSREVLFRNR